MDDRPNILIIGGAGYIGSHVTALLRSQGYKTLVFDNLSTGHKELVRGPFVYGNILDYSALEDVFASHKIEVIIHLAAKSLVPESISMPLFYYENNISGTLNILKLMSQYGVKKVVFSSSASVYGSNVSVPVTEDFPPNPDNVYGFTKVAIERMIRDSSIIHGFSYVVLRYFNAAGAHPDGFCGELHIPETHLVPRVLDVAIGNESHIVVYGTDYDTPDGTCIRDYVHVLDIADAHLRAIKWIVENDNDIEDGGMIFNVGTSRGFSVMEVIDMAQKVTGVEIPVVYGERRHGDPPRLVADAEKIKKVLGWKPLNSSLEFIISTAWNWHRARRKRIATFARSR